MTPNEHVYPVGTAGRYHRPHSDGSLGGLYSRCGLVPLDHRAGRSPDDVGWFEQCHHPACRREYDGPTS